MPVDYAVYSIWQRQALLPGVIDTQMEYWKKQLAGIEPVLLPTDFPRPPVQSHDGALHSFRIPAEVLDGLKRLSKSQGITLFMTTLAAFQLQMAALSGIDRFAVGSAAAGREHRSLEGTVGYFVNPIAVLADTSGNPTIVDFLQTLVRMLFLLTLFLHS